MKQSSQFIRRSQNATPLFEPYVSSVSTQKPSLLKSALLAVGASAALSVSACSTVIVQGEAPAAPTHRSIERNALQGAAADLATVHWPKPTVVSMGERLTGIFAETEDRITKSDAVDAYVAQLRLEADPQSRLLQDASAQLNAAASLASAAHQVASTVDPALAPVMADVALVEGAIGQLRQAREIYLASLEEVAPKSRLTENLSDTLRADFGRAIRQVGEAADILADRIAEERERVMAARRAGDRIARFGPQ